MAKWHIDGLRRFGLRKIIIIEVVLNLAYLSIVNRQLPHNGRG